MNKIKNVLKSMILSITSFIPTFSMEREENAVEHEQGQESLISCKVISTYFDVENNCFLFFFDNIKVMETLAKMLFLCSHENYYNIAKELQLLSPEEFINKSMNNFYISDYDEPMKYKDMWEQEGWYNYIYIKNPLHIFNIIDQSCYQNLVEFSFKKTDIHSCEGLLFLEAAPNLKKLTINTSNIMRNKNTLYESLLHFIARGYFKNLNIHYIACAYHRESNISINGAKISRGNIKFFTISYKRLNFNNKDNYNIQCKCKDSNIEYLEDVDTNPVKLKVNTREYKKIQDNLYQNSLIE